MKMEISDKDIEKIKEKVLIEVVNMTKQYIFDNLRYFAKELEKEFDKEMRYKWKCFIEEVVTLKMVENENEKNKQNKQKKE